MAQNLGIPQVKTMTVATVEITGIFIDYGLNVVTIRTDENGIIIEALMEKFFDEGIAYLKPLTMQVVADALDLHESTVSRAIANKYAQTPIPGRFFYSREILLESWIAPGTGL